MSRRRDRLTTVRQVVERREMDDARRLGQFQSTLAEAVRQLELLREHRDGESRRLRESGAITPAQLSNRMAFLSRLDAAIAEQERVVERAESGLAELRRRWLAARCRTQAVDKLGERRRAAQEKTEARREQHELDEHALRAVRDTGESH